MIDCAATYTAFHGLRTRADARTEPNGGRKRRRSHGKKSRPIADTSTDAAGADA